MEHLLFFCSKSLKSQERLEEELSYAYPFFMSRTETLSTWVMGIVIFVFKEQIIIATPQEIAGLIKGLLTIGFP